MDKHHNSLQPGYKLHWYLIKKILGQGGFGITYLAEDTNLNHLVAIKEYLPPELAVRDGDASIQPLSGDHGEQFSWGLERFMSEAQTLAKFKHPNIVRVLTVFPENNSAYMVMEFENGRGLHEILKERKTIPENELNKILLPILDGLESVHKAGFVHRDIKPPNIYIRDDGSPVLLDFGSARQSLSEQTRTLTTMVSPGYAPFEQYVGKSDKQGPWTDIYGLGATLYRAVTGIAPSNSMDRSEAILHTGKDIYVSAVEIARGKYSDQFLTAIDHALMFKSELRPQSIADWRKTLLGNPPQITREQITTGPEIKESITESEVKTVTSSINDSVMTEVKTSLAGRMFDNLYHTIKKLLKWSAVLLVILIIIGILKNGQRNKDINLEESTINETLSPVTEIITEPEPAPEPVTTPVTADKDSDKQKQIAELLAGAEKNMVELRLTTPAGNNAVEKYKSVLAIDPTNYDAINGIDRVVDKYIELMDRAIEENNIPAARNYLSKGTRVNPEYFGLNSARQRLDAAARQDNSRRITTDTGDKQIPEQDTSTKTVEQEDRSLVPESERREIKELREKILQNPDDKNAKRQMRRLAKTIEDNLKEAIKNENYDLAEDYVKEILKYAQEDSKKTKDLNDLLLKIQKKKLEQSN